jgi:hypothetical protein
MLPAVARDSHLLHRVAAAAPLMQGFWGEIPGNSEGTFREGSVGFFCSRSANVYTLRQGLNLEAT